MNMLSNYFAIAVSYDPNLANVHGPTSLMVHLTF